jgi:NAD(P)-dependent dehydrogenase (short-subunit alcohol dehydrogenase family)
MIRVVSVVTRGGKPPRCAGRRRRGQHGVQEKLLKIILIGAGGTIGRAVATELGARHELIRAGRNGPDVRVDITDARSIADMYARVGQVDAVVSAAGHAYFGPLATMTEANVYVGIRDKLMGQVNLVLLGHERLSDGGSFTLTTGVLADDYIRNGAAASLANGAIEAFVRAAALEMPRGQRINVVSPTVIAEALDKYGPYFRGFAPVSAARAALGYAKSVEGAQTGQIIRIHT